MMLDIDLQFSINGVIEEIADHEDIDTAALKSLSRHAAKET